MQFSVYINQPRALEWGLNAQQAMLFSFVYEVPSWAGEVVVDGDVFYRLSRSKVIEEMPLLTDKPDTVYRLLKQLEAKGLVRLTNAGPVPLISITEKGRLWNKAMDGSEGRKNIRDERPLTPDKNPSYPGKISDLTPEKYPTNHIYQDHITNISNNPPVSPQGGSATPSGDGEAEKAKATPKARGKLTKTDLINDFGLPEDLAVEFLQVRKDKRATLTPRAMASLVREFEKAGLSIHDGIELCCRRSWAGFKASWDWQDAPDAQRQHQRDGRPAPRHTGLTATAQGFESIDGGMTFKI